LYCNWQTYNTVPEIYTHVNYAHCTLTDTHITLNDTQVHGDNQINTLCTRAHEHKYQDKQVKL